MDIDRRGRRRRPEQVRGLRPLFPLLPERWTSQVLRVAMSETDWARFAVLVDAAAEQAPTHARACGMVISRLMDQAGAPGSGPGPEPSHWMDWERRKALKLLRSAI